MIENSINLAIINALEIYSKNIFSGVVMFYITEVFNNAKLSKDHIYTGTNKKDEIVKADASVTAILNDKKGYDNDLIRASSEISTEIHAQVAKILQKVSDKVQECWKDKYIGGMIVSRMISLLGEEAKKIKQDNLLVHNLLRQVMHILHKEYNGDGYITLIAEKPLMCEFLFHNDHRKDIGSYQFLKENNGELIKGRAIIGGTPDLIIVEQNNEYSIHDMECPAGRHCKFSVIDFKNVTQEKFSYWQMQLHIYEKMFIEYLSARNIPNYCAGLYVCNSVDQYPTYVSIEDHESARTANRKFRDLYLSKFNSQDSEELEKLAEDVAEVIDLGKRIKDIEKWQKLFLTRFKEREKEKIDNIKEKFKKIKNTDIPFTFKGEGFALTKVGKYRTAIDMEEANLIPRLKKTTFNGYSNKFSNALGSFNFDDENDCEECENKNCSKDNI